MLRRGIDLLFGKELLRKSASSTGFTYAATDLTTAFVGHFRTAYAFELRDRAAWVALKFGDYDDDSLTGFMNRHVREWGAEFARESLFVKVRH